MLPVCLDKRPDVIYCESCAYAMPDDTPEDVTLCDGCMDQLQESYEEDMAAAGYDSSDWFE